MVETDHQGGRVDRVMLFAGPLAVLALIVWLASWTGDEHGGGGGVDALLVLAESLPLALAWLGGAVGIGRPLRHWLAPHISRADGLALQAGLGVAALLTIDAALGRLGLLGAGHGFLAWLILVAGLILLIDQARRATKATPNARWKIPPSAWTAAPALAVLLLAACSAPGWLWRSEFGGYDALSYHLQLPKEWLANGRIEGLPHNVYSHLPGYVEAAYLHLMILRGDAIKAAYACQLFHALLAILTASITARLAARIAGEERGRWAGPAAFVLVLGTPWVVVTGSLAYNEMAVALMLACGLLLVAASPRGSIRLASGIAVLAAAACGAKLTAIGFVALPLALLALTVIPPRRWPLAIPMTALVAAIVLSPWLIGNGRSTGNPVFPFLGSMLGFGHWTTEQAAIFHDGHQFHGGLTDRLVALWNQWLRYGMGANPRAGEPWLPQWSILPWLAMAGTIVAAARRAPFAALARLWIVIVVQIAFWLFATHLQSRFLLPAVVPAATLAACGFAGLAFAHPGRAMAALSALLLLAWSVVPSLVFRGEAGGAPAARVGVAMLLAGDGLSDAQARDLAQRGSRAIFVNRLLPASEKTLLVGDGAPFYYDDRAIAYQTTWDRGPLSAAMRSAPDDAAAWMRSLRERGFTYLLVDPGMLQIWERSRWNDPLLTAGHVIGAADSQAALLHRFPDGSVIYELRAQP